MSRNAFIANYLRATHLSANLTRYAAQLGGTLANNGQSDFHLDNPSIQEQLGAIRSALEAVERALPPHGLVQVRPEDYTVKEGESLHRLTFGGRTILVPNHGDNIEVWIQGGTVAVIFRARTDVSCFVLDWPTTNEGQTIHAGREGRYSEAFTTGQRGLAVIRAIAAAKSVPVGGSAV